MMAPLPTALVYRLRGLPSEIENYTQAAKLLGWALGHEVSDIEVYSLATVTISSWTGTTKTATVMFRKMPRLVLDSPNKDEWTITHPCLEDSLLLDSHFRGMTPLHDIAPRHEHLHSCIAISGLSSHPFGSWQPRGGNKEFMWLRDVLPRRFPTMRVWVYGYDTDLRDDTSFQSISDLSISLINHLEASDFASPNAPKIIVLAHSLGGIVFKEAISNLARGGEKSIHILRLIRGAILFGVPNLGMEQSHLQTLVRHQPNRSLVEDLAVESPYLLNLDKRFLAHKSNQGMKVAWAYETRTSSIVEADQDGRIYQSTTRRVLVSRESATSNFINQKVNLTIPINKDHSSIVKYHKDDEDCNRVLFKIGELVNPIIELPPETPGSFKASPILGPFIGRYGKWLPELVTSSFGASSPSTLGDVHLEEAIMSVPADMLVSTLNVPELSQRHEGIEKRSLHTFEWIFENDELAFRKWLRSEEKLYWIRGKPGSGKSTLMKFIYDDPRTRVLLDDWKKTEEPIVASFFFHHRGSVLQKSLEGLQRSILAQILHQRPQLADGMSSIIEEAVVVSLPIIKKDLESKLKDHVWKRNDLSKMLRHILRQDSHELDICFFFDALDEYDGEPDRIKEFLADLHEESSVGRTNVKICFSSRSWESFTQSFSHYPGFSIHKHTTDDIQAYCHQELEKHKAITGIVGPLVPEITEIARGVFLWAKLALRDLIKAGTTSTTDPEALRARLNSLPMELKDYYEEIIKRCPQWSRLKAYVLLEIATRSDDVLSLPQVSLLLACSNSPTFDACWNAIENEIGGRDVESLDFIQTRKTITNACGGLLEVKKSEAGWYVQLMHQTVRDFVLGPKFKTLLLGSRANFQHENGHSFLGKLFLTQRGLDMKKRGLGLGSKTKRLSSVSFPEVEKIHYHFKQAEMTTGESQLQFISSFPPNVLKFALQILGETNPQFQCLPHAQFKFATKIGLHLCLKELITQRYPNDDEKDEALVQFMSFVGHRGCFQQPDSKESLNVFDLLGFEFGNISKKLFSNDRLNLISRYPIVRTLPHPQNEYDKELGPSASIESFPTFDLQGFYQPPANIIQIHDELVVGMKSLMKCESDPEIDRVTPFHCGMMICNPTFIQLILQQGWHRTDRPSWPRVFIERAMVFWGLNERPNETYHISVALVQSVLLILDHLGWDQSLVIRNIAAWPSVRQNVLILKTLEKKDGTQSREDLLSPELAFRLLGKLDMMHRKSLSGSDKPSTRVELGDQADIEEQVDFRNSSDQFEYYKGRWHEAKKRKQDASAEAVQEVPKKLLKKGSIAAFKKSFKKLKTTFSLVSQAA